MTLQEIQKELKVPKGHRNSFGNYNYRNCEDILEAVKPLLGDCVLTLSDEIIHFPSTVQPTLLTTTDDKGKQKTEIVFGDRFYVKATAHFSESDKSFYEVTAYARESLDKKGMDSAQITGAASSYARKYALNGLFLIDDTKDADSEENREETEQSGSFVPHLEQGEQTIGPVLNRFKRS